MFLRLGNAQDLLLMMKSAAFISKTSVGPDGLPEGASYICKGFKSLLAFLNHSGLDMNSRPSVVYPSAADVYVSQEAAEEILAAVSNACGSHSAEVQANLHRILVSLQHSSVKVRPCVSCAKFIQSGYASYTIKEKVLVKGSSSHQTGSW